jgi:hypothetical protein
MGCLVQGVEYLRAAIQVDYGERLWQMTTTWLYGFSSLILRARRSMATSMVDCNSRL